MSTYALRATTEIIAEITAGRGLGLAAAASRFPGHRGGGQLNSATNWRWLCRGVRLPDGTTLQLEGARVGGRVLTSEAALARFVAAQSPASISVPSTQPRTPTQRQRAAAKAAKELDAIGI
jgi:hypothetical protein